MEGKQTERPRPVPRTNGAGGGSPHAVSKELEPVLATRYRGCSKFGRMSKTPVCGTF